MTDVFTSSFTMTIFLFFLSLFFSFLWKVFLLVPVSFISVSVGKLGWSWFYISWSLLAQCSSSCSSSCHPSLPLLLFDLYVAWKVSTRIWFSCWLFFSPSGSTLELISTIKFELWSKFSRMLFHCMFQHVAVRFLVLVISKVLSCSLKPWSAAFHYVPAAYVTQDVS